MMTHGHLSRAGSPPLIERMLPRYGTALAWTILAVVAWIAAVNDGCQGYAEQGALTHLLVVALLVQVAALSLAFARFGWRLPRAGLGLLGTCSAALVAFPAAGMIYLAIHPLFCGGWIF